MYTLYYTTRSYTLESTALIPRIALEEIGAAYTVVDVELESNPPDWYLAINPHGKIPTLSVNRDEETLHIYPSPAILLSLADLHKEAALVPASPLNRAICYRRLLDMVEQLHSGYMQRLFSFRYSTEDSHTEFVKRKSQEWILNYMNAAERDLASSKFIAANLYSICDIYFYVMMRWYVDLVSQDNLPPISTFVNINQYCLQLERRVAVKAALAADDLQAISAS